MLPLLRIAIDAPCITAQLFPVSSLIETTNETPQKDRQQCNLNLPVETISITRLGNSVICLTKPHCSCISRDSLSCIAQLGPSPSNSFVNSQVFNMRKIYSTSFNRNSERTLPHSLKENNLQAPWLIHTGRLSSIYLSLSVVRLSSYSLNQTSSQPNFPSLLSVRS